MLNHGLCRVSASAGGNSGEVTMAAVCQNSRRHQAGRHQQCTHPHVTSSYFVWAFVSHPYVLVHVAAADGPYLVAYLTLRLPDWPTCPSLLESRYECSLDTLILMLLQPAFITYVKFIRHMVCSLCADKHVTQVPRPNVIDSLCSVVLLFASIPVFVVCINSKYYKHSCKDTCSFRDTDTVKDLHVH